MTDASGLREFVSAYVLEAEEHLETAAKQLLAIEESLRSGGANLRALREAFRSLHTIKGLSAMVGVEPVVALSHAMESLLRSADRKSAKLAFEAIDVLLDGVQAIRSRVRAFGNGEAVALPEPELLRAIEELDTEHVAPAFALPALDLDPSLIGKLGPLEIEQLKGGLAAGKRALRIEFTPSIEKSTRGITINQVRERVQALADVVKVFPTSTPAQPGAPGGLSFVLVLLSEASDEELAQAASVSLESIQILARATRGALSALAPEAGLETPDLEELELPRRGVVRVDVSRLDDTVEGLSSLIVNRFRLARAVKTLREQGVDVRELEEIINDNGRQLRGLRTAILRVRMVPVGELLDRMPLIVRSLRRTVNRRVRLELESGGAEVDKAVSERLFPALVHLLRNAVDHAIETPDERARRQKPEEGLVRIECSSKSNRWLEVRVSDDGRGIDPIAVAERAGVPVPQSEAALLELICRSGLSTREIATTTSGRGMGMEIVKRITTEQLGGELSLHSEPGVGTSFTLLVPLSISVVDAFSFVCAGQRFVTPVASIEEIIDVEASSVYEGAALPGQAPVRLVQRRGRAVPLVSLAGIFALPSANREARALVVRRGAERLAFAIERMLGQAEVVVRPLNDVLVKVPGVAGATDLGDGRPTLVLDLLSLGARVSGMRTELLDA